MMLSWDDKSQRGTRTSTSRAEIRRRPRSGTVGSRLPAVRTRFNKECMHHQANLCGRRVALVRVREERILVWTLVNVHLIEINAHQDETTAKQSTLIGSFKIPLD